MVSKVETNPKGFSDWGALHRLLIDAFAYMEARIDPPSSLAAMSVRDLADKAAQDDLFVVLVDQQPIACLFGADHGTAYHVGKLAVAAIHRRQGHARALIEAAAAHARATGHTALTLQSRVELTENHASFLAMGFTIAGTTSHSGHVRPTSLTFHRAL